MLVSGAYGHDCSLLRGLNDIPIKSYRIDMKGYANFGGFYGVSDKFPVGFDRVVCDVSIETDAPEEQVKQFQEMIEQRVWGMGR